MLSKPTANTWSESNSASLHQTQGDSIRCASMVLVSPPRSSSWRLCTPVGFGMMPDTGLSAGSDVGSSGMPTTVRRHSRSWWSMCAGEEWGGPIRVRRPGWGRRAWGGALGPRSSGPGPADPWPQPPRSTRARPRPSPGPAPAQPSPGPARLGPASAKPGPGPAQPRPRLGSAQPRPAPAPAQCTVTKIGLVYSQVSAHGLPSSGPPPCGIGPAGSTSAPIGPTPERFPSDPRSRR